MYKYVLVYDCCNIFLTVIIACKYDPLAKGIENDVYS